MFISLLAKCFCSVTKPRRDSIVSVVRMHFSFPHKDESPPKRPLSAPTSSSVGWRAFRIFKLMFFYFLQIIRFLSRDKNVLSFVTSNTSLSRGDGDDGAVPPSSTCNPSRPRVIVPRGASILPKDMAEKYLLRVLLFARLVCVTLNAPSVLAPVT